MWSTKRTTELVIVDGSVAVFIVQPEERDDLLLLKRESHSVHTLGEFHELKFRVRVALDPGLLDY